MNTQYTFPETLIDAVRYFSDPTVCQKFVKNMRWSEGVVCPRCGCTDVTFMLSVSRWNCKGCRKQFSVKVGTIFEESPLSLDKWLCGIWLITNAKNGISSCEAAHALGITQKSAWFLLHRIRLARQMGSIEKMDGTIEGDETFVGGLEKNKHKDKKLKAGRGTVGKTIVMGVLERAKGDRGYPLE